MNIEMKPNIPEEEKSQEPVLPVDDYVEHEDLVDEGELKEEKPPQVPEEGELDDDE